MTPRPESYRSGTKQARMIEMMRRRAGAGIDEIACESSGRPRATRGTMAEVLKTRFPMPTVSHKDEDQPRRHPIVG